ncbi:Mfa1 family fimbria major subunit [Segatella copri]|uniref:Mfa1 family fimbria major subunit n=1 Tax=Segatella copri TaxID=165179 RepID=UPI00293A3CD8|nr:Mfa1 family fimbria major subunit [Segatella copri]MDV3106646.1 Mfa1 family fimbria major subunit [Segatella copri]WOG31253.1 Mfa1 family fimbria major subunit [Segatella copri]
MKIKHLFGLAVIAAMTASCSSNEDLGTAGSGTGNNEAGVGYATFTINLPSTNGTRAGDPTYDQGTAKEYDVNDVTLLIFQKTATSTSEGDYTFVEKADLGNMAPWKAEGSHGITASATITAKLSNVALTNEGSTSDYYALAILNNNADATGAGKVKLPTTGTYSTWNDASNADVAKFTDNTNGFYMANAPVFVAGGEPTTLVNINRVYATKQKAETNAATTIHVERGLAKVSIESDAFPSTITPSGTNYNEDKVDITAWKLDVTNKSTFPIHKTAGLKNTNFSTIWSNTPTTTGASVTRFVDGDNPSFKRVHWGIDPNYSTALDNLSDCQGAFNVLPADATIDGAANEPQYCLENTFDIEHMKQGQTTRVVFKATYTPKGLPAGEKTFYKIGNSTDLWSEANLIAQIKAKAAEVLSVASSAITVDLDATENDIKNNAGTKLLVKENVKNGGTAVSPADIAKINEKLGLKAATTTDPIVGIATYKDGESYYIARIKHFGVLTPWAEGQDTYGTNNEENNTKYLGRYGVLRNNWYELKVGSVSGPGTPDVPTIKPDVPDDESFRYISVSVKILSWAKRSDTVDL